MTAGITKLETALEADSYVYTRVNTCNTEHSVNATGCFS